MKRLKGDSSTKEEITMLPSKGFQNPYLRKCTPLTAVGVNLLPVHLRDMKFYCMLFLIITAYGCDTPIAQQEKRMFDEFIFSFSEECCSYSLKFGDNDTVFMQRQFPDPDNFFAIAKRAQVQMLDSFIKAIELSRYDTVYFQNNLHDGGSYKFYLRFDTIVKWTFVYGNEAPKALYEFGDWLRNMKSQLTYTRTDMKVDFGDLKYIELPIVPPPPIKENSR